MSTENKEYITREEFEQHKEKTKALFTAIHDWMEATDKIHQSFELQLVGIEKRLEKMHLWIHDKTNIEASLHGHLTTLETEIEEIKEKLKQIVEDRAYFDNVSETDGLGQKGNTF